MDSGRLAELEGEDHSNLALGKAERLTELYGVSAFELASPDGEVIKPTLPDFRTDNLRPAVVGGRTWEVIHRTERYQREVEEIFEDDPHLATVRKFHSLTEDVEIRKAGIEIRRLLQLNWEHQVSSERNIELYDYLRWSIEKIGVNVIQAPYPIEDSRGFCLLSTAPGADIICVNERGKTKRARVFTLAHELVHVLVRRQGVSDFTLQRNKIERFCNEVAAEILMPRDAMRDFIKAFCKTKKVSIGDVAALSKRLGVSQLSFVVRAENLALASNGLLKAWRSRFEAQADSTINPWDVDQLPDDPIEEGDENSGRGNAGTQKIRFLGLNLSSLALAAVERSVRDPVDVYRVFGIKPEHTVLLQNAINKRATAEL